MLASTPLAPPPAFSFEDLARRTDGLSGSDLKETCRNAAMRPVRELMRAKGAEGGLAGMEQARREVGVVAIFFFCRDFGTLKRPETSALQGFKLRPLELSDFIITDSHAYNHVDPSRRYTARQHDLEEEPVD
jgi:SpoVK/Ycf46/Vps4 family AAA+-type ATPase